MGKTIILIVSAIVGYPLFPLRRLNKMSDYLVSKLLDAVGENRGLAIVDIKSRQIVDIFRTPEIAKIIRRLKKVD